MKALLSGLALLVAHTLALPQAQVPVPAPADDAARIPLSVLGDADAAPSGAAAPPPPSTSSVFGEANGEGVQRRRLDVPVAPAMRRGVLRLLADGRGDWQLAPGWIARVSGRIAVQETKDGARSRNEQFDLREAALQWRASDRDVLETGRVNLRQGAAYGFNPTDYFSSRTLVDASTRDPQMQRVNRLGTAMVNAQRVGETGSLLVAFAPRLAQSARYAEHEPQTRLRLGETNGESRLLVKGQWALSPGVRPELLAFHDGDGWRVGANLTQGFGQQTIGYAEYSGGRQRSLWQRSVEDGVRLGDLPSAALALTSPEGQARWRHRLAIGGTWTSESRLSLTAEFDYQQTGWSRTDWQRWFALGTTAADGARLAWYLRGYAAAQQEPLFRRSLFLRAQWDQAGHRDINLNAFVNHNLDDGSTLAQVAAEYRLSQSSRLRAMALFTAGADRSQFGSDPARWALLLGYLHYL